MKALQVEGGESFIKSNRPGFESSIIVFDSPWDLFILDLKIHLVYLSEKIVVRINENMHLYT